MNTSGQIAWYDEVTPVWKQGVDVRAAFIARTYTHLLAAVAAFAAIEFAVFSAGLAEPLTRALAGSRWGWLLVMGAFVVVGMLATKAAHASRSKPVQYAALFGFVAAEALIFVPILYMAHTYFAGEQVIEKAALASAAGFAGLTAIAFLTRKDFSFLRGILMWGGMAAIVMIVVSVVFGLTLGTFFAVAMVALAGASILYDTSNVLHHYPADMHVGAALSLFASVAMLFYYVLYLMMSMRD
jgi:FtsH-binding integral membrane protein